VVARGPGNLLKTTAGHAATLREGSTVSDVQSAFGS
jgi:hypothetical protein